MVQIFGLSNAAAKSDTLQNSFSSFLAKAQSQSAKPPVAAVEDKKAGGVPFSPDKVDLGGLAPLTEDEIDTSYLLNPANKPNVFDSRGNSTQWNYADRKGAIIDKLIIHATAGSFKNTMAEFKRRGGTSAHYVIDLDGTIYRVVDEAYAAYHAGLPRDASGRPKPGAIANQWDGDGADTGLNPSSIGIEVVNPGVPVPPGKNAATWNVTDGGDYYAQPSFTDAQYKSLARLSMYIRDRNREIAPYNVIAHSDAKPEAKADPGVRFPWKEFAELGLGLYVPAGTSKKGKTFEQQEKPQFDSEVLKWQQDFRRAGYTMLDANGLYDTKMAKVVQGFKLHYMPASVNGVLDPAAQETIAALAEAREKAKAGWQANKLAKIS